jgi:hypothetical protein
LKPGLFAPVTAARRSLATILAARRKGAVPPVAAVTEATAMPVPQIVEPVSEAAADVVPVEVAVAAGDVVAADAGPAPVEDGPQLTAARQRLVDLIAERLVIETAEAERVSAAELPARAEPLAADIITEAVLPIDSAEVAEAPMAYEAPAEPGTSDVTATQSAFVAPPALRDESGPSDSALSELSRDIGVMPICVDAPAPDEGLASIGAEAALATPELTSDTPARPEAPRLKRQRRKRRSRKV